MNGRELAAVEPHAGTPQLVVLAVHKPPGVLTAWGPDARSGRATLDALQLSAFAPDSRKLMHVGRLDVDSEGLLLVTNDGALAHSLAHPSLAPRKVYVASVVALPLTRSATLRPVSGPCGDVAALVARLCAPQGLLLPADPRDGAAGAAASAAAPRARALSARALSPAAAAAAAPHASAAACPPTGDSSSAPTRALVEIVVAEGRKRLVRRLVAACGWRVDRLVRTAVGPVALGALLPGACRVLAPHEVAALVAATRGGKSPRDSESASDFELVGAGAARLL